jgi:hypothetical protein
VLSRRSSLYDSSITKHEACMKSSMSGAHFHFLPIVHSYNGMWAGPSSISSISPSPSPSPSSSRRHWHIGLRGIDLHDYLPQGTHSFIRTRKKCHCHSTTTIQLVRFTYKHYREILDFTLYPQCRCRVAKKNSKNPTEKNIRTIITDGS